MAKRTGALVFLDAVHLAPHAAVDVTRWGCDFLACSAYKFFGPHVGILWGRRALLESLTPYKVRPAADSLPERWMTGTQNFAGIAGVRAAVQYLFDLTAKLANTAAVTRQSFEEGMNAIVAEERRLGARLIAGLTALPDVRVYGIIDPARFAERVPTLSFTHRRLEPSEVARRLGEQAIFVWHGNFYALPLTEALGLEPDGMVRVGLLHPNSADEIDRFLAAVAEL
jgi:selenocysteine lyase/cysteine desulfurase